MKTAITILLAVMLTGCASYPTTIKQDFNYKTGTRTDTVCTHNKYMIPIATPWIIGIFSWNGAEKCEDIQKAIDAPTAEQETGKTWKGRD